MKLFFKQFLDFSEGISYKAVQRSRILSRFYGPPCISRWIFSELQEIESYLCSFTCSGVNKKCGGRHGFFSVYDSVSTKPKSVSFTLQKVMAVIRGLLRERQFIKALIKIICPRRSRGLIIILPARRSQAKVKCIAHERGESRQGIYWHE